MSRDIVSQECGSAEWQGLDHFLNQRFALLIGQYLVQDIFSLNENNTDLNNLRSSYKTFDTLWSKAIQETTFVKGCDELAAQFRQEQLIESLKKCDTFCLDVAGTSLSAPAAGEIKYTLEALKSKPNDDQIFQNFKNQLSRDRNFSCHKRFKVCSIVTTILAGVALSTWAFYLAATEPTTSSSDDPTQSSGKIVLYCIATIVGLLSIIGAYCSLRIFRTQNQNKQFLQDTISGMDSMGLYNSLLQQSSENLDSSENLEAGSVAPTA